MSNAAKRYAAELIATFTLVFAGTGAMIVNDVTAGTVTHVGVALTFGLVVMAMIYTVGDVSGAHMNPAVTLAFWIARRHPAREVLPYILGQCAGAVVASAVLRALFRQHDALGATLPAAGVGSSFALEVALGFVLMFVILGVATGAKEKGAVAGIAVGAAVALGSLFGGPISGASMNPARSLGPALVSGEMHGLWMYLVAPTLGAGLAVLGCACVRERGCCDGANTKCDFAAEGG